jgi:hypothetical protein
VFFVLAEIKVFTGKKKKKEKKKEEEIPYSVSEYIHIIHVWTAFDPFLIPNILLKK